MTQDARAVPFLPSLDLAATEEFYTASGVEATARYPHEGYLILALGGIELHFWRCQDAQLAQNSGCYIRCADAGRLHDLFSAARVQTMTAPIDRPWGMREFHLIDPSGNLPRVGSPL